MAIKTSSGPGSELDRILRDVGQPDTRALFYFFSSELAGSGIVEAVNGRFPGAACVGASMIGGWSNAGAIEKGVTAMTISSDEVAEAFVAMREGVKDAPAQVARDVLSDLKRQLGGRRLNPAEYIGVILFDGLCLGEEIMRELMVAEDFPIPLVGGAAADELAFEATYVASGARMSSDGLVLLVLRMKVPFYYDHFVHCRPAGSSMVVTKSEPSRRVVWEIDGKPAAVRYAELLGLPGPEAVGVMDFSRRPFGVAIGDTVYVRSPNAVVDGTGLQFYCYIEAGTTVSLLEPGDILENAREALGEANRRLGEVRGALLFNCVLRYLELKASRSTAAFNDIFAAAPFIGFNTFGEELFTHHNQTLTAIFIGR